MFSKEVPPNVFQGGQMQKRFGLGRFFRAFYHTALPFAKTWGKVVKNNNTGYWCQHYERCSEKFEFQKITREMGNTRRTKAFE